MISVVTDVDVLATSRTSLGLPIPGEIDEIYIAASLRRLAGFMCPCSPKTLIGSMVDSHRSMKQIDNDFLDRIESVLESLVAIGDLLELRDVTTLDETVKSTWVFAAPPSFVLRPSGNAFLLGVSADEATPLPVDLRGRIKYRGVARSIDPMPSELLGRGDAEHLVERSGELHLDTDVTVVVDEYCPGHARLNVDDPPIPAED